MKIAMVLRQRRKTGVTARSSTVLAFLAAAVGMGGFSDMCEAQTARKSQSMYRSSFSKPEVFVHDGIPESMKGEKDTVDVPSLNSFPLRVQVDESNVTGWMQPQSLAAPKKINKTFKVGNCQFDIVSSEFSVRQYGDDGQVTADAIMPESTISVDKGKQALFSVSTSLSVAVNDKFKGVCKEALTGRSFYVGKASLDGSNLYGIGDKGGSVSAATHKQETSAKLFVSWNQETDKLSMVDHIGLVPEIESHIYAMTFDNVQSYYLGFEASFKINRDKQKVAKK